MKLSLLIKIALGIALIILLLFVGIRLVTTLTETVVGMLSNEPIIDESDDYQLYTPEPMPTMPPYISDDSFYDNAGDVVFGDE